MSGTKQRLFGDEKQLVVTSCYLELLIHATTWMNLENIMPSERSQTQKTTQCMAPFM